MKFTAALTSLVFLLPALADARVVYRDFNDLSARAGGFQGGQGGKGGNNGAGKAGATNNNGNNGNNGAGAAAGTGTGNAAAASASASATSGGDLQSSTTLDPSVIATGFALDGQQNATAGQVPSLTSTNNFINFCATTNLPITNGQQITTGSCNPAPMGVIASTANIPAAKFQSPKNLDTIAANTDFTVSMALNHLQAGNFVNAASNYYSAPQQVNAQGDIIGHTHIVIEQLQSLTQTTPLDSSKFVFFKGVDTAQQNGAVTADVAGGLPAGFYRMASINSAANHQPVLVAVAQHGSLDDMVYFTVTDNGQAAAGAGAAASTSAAAGAAASSAAATGAGAAAGKGNAGKGAGKKGGRRSFLARESY